MGEVHVEGQGISHVYRSRGRELLAIGEVNLRVAQGEFVSIIGPSGCGKSTLLRIIGGLLEPTRGRVSIAGLPPREAQRRKQIGFVFQDAALLPWRTVAANVRLPLEIGRTNGDKDETVASALEMVGLSGFADYHPHQLSGGMQQRVALARSLVFSPGLLLMDEPFGSLDEITREAMRLELVRLWERDRSTVLFVTHAITEAVLLSDRVVVMSSRPGRIRASLEIDLPRPRTEETESTAAFTEYMAQLRAMLRE